MILPYYMSSVGFAVPVSQVCVSPSVMNNAAWQSKGVSGQYPKFKFLICEVLLSKSAYLLLARPTWLMEPVPVQSRQGQTCISVRRVFTDAALNAAAWSFQDLSLICGATNLCLSAGTGHHPTQIYPSKPP